MKAFITGGAGFIGSTMVDRLLAEGHEVTAYDDFSNGRREFLANALDRPHFRLVQGDVLDAEKMGAALRGHDLVFHFAANADVRRGLEHPRRDLEQNTMATFTVLETMRHAGVKRIAFSSTGSIYGEPRVSSPLTAKGSAFRAACSGSSPSWGRGTTTGTSSTSTSSSAPTPADYSSRETASSGSPTCTYRTASTRCCMGCARRLPGSTCSTWGRTSTSR